MRKVRNINLTNCTDYSSNDMINIKNLNPNNINIDKKLYKNIIIYYIGYGTPNSLKPLHNNINNANRYIEESNENK